MYSAVPYLLCQNKTRTQPEFISVTVSLKGFTDPPELDIVLRFGDSRAQDDRVEIGRILLREEGVW